ncbi:MAG: hypothetical protein V1753_12350, partial [Pseudomonadota bacterium]
NNEANVVFIWDADGDRFNIVTIASVDDAMAAKEIGLEVEPLDSDRSCVYFKPNQIYFMLTAVKLEALAASGDLGQYNWIIATTYPTSRSIGELALSFNNRYKTNLKTFQAPVGFKYFGDFVHEIETKLIGDNNDVTLTDVIGEKHNLGRTPRILIMAEESGGASMGTAGFYASAKGFRKSLALKEKDGMQIGVMAIALAARLKGEGKSFAGFYREKIEENNIVYCHYNRTDVTLFDESLRGEARINAEALGNERKEKIVRFFKSLTLLSPDAAHEQIRNRVDIILPSIKSLYWAGDGSYIDFGDTWFGLRASGTDAVLRYYIEGKERSRIDMLAVALMHVRI